jgi:hypothetical protein
MPFGLAPAPEEFQRRMDIALEGLEGAKTIADDILVFGTGSTDERADKSHDERLKAVLERCKQKGIKLNKEKTQFKQKKVSYMGHVIAKEGLSPDPNKIKAIIDMPRPSDKQAVQRVLGMVNYVQRFAPQLSDITKPLRDLIKKGNEFIWDDTVQGKAWDQIKAVLTQAPILRYYDPKKQSVLQCDASKDGLGACLMQDSYPIAYASRALTPTEVNYAQIEKAGIAGCGLWYGKVLRVLIWKGCDSRIGSQTTGNHHEEKSSLCSQKATEDASTLTEV